MKPTTARQNCKNYYDCRPQLMSALGQKQTSD
jgi:hypothetical protein